MDKKIVGILVCILLIATSVLPIIGNANDNKNSFSENWPEQDKLTALDGAASEQFGYSVCIDGEYALIGAPGDDHGGLSGSAYVFKRSGTTWTEQQKLTASDGAADDYFGSSVYIDGEYALIGAYGDDDNGIYSGSAYVFKRSGTTWTEQQKLTASDGAATEQFGYPVCIDGEYALIGAHGDDDNGAASGSAYVFKRNGTTWTEQQKLTASDGAAEDWFGYSVCIDGEYALIGACYDDDNGGFSGSAYVFKRSGTTWTEQQKLTASDGAGGDNFGYSVCIDGEYVLIGARLDDDNGGFSGSAYVFKRSGTTWTEQQKLTASDGAGGDIFGFPVCIDGEYVLMGAHKDDDNGGRSGSAYVFKRSGTTWTEQQKLTASDGAADDYFGYSVCIDGEYALIGAYGDDDNGASSGSAYVFKRKQPPCADFTYSPINPATRDIVQFTNTSTDVDGYIASWSWDFGDGTISSIPNPTHQYSSNGTYCVTLEVMDDDGETDSISKPVFVGGIYISGLSSGWSFVSLPFNQSIDLTNLVVNCGCVDYTWSEATNPANGPIIDPNVYGWDRSMNMYVPATTLEPGYGYWMYAYSDCHLGIFGIDVNPDDFITDLNQKWNSIGVPSMLFVNISDLIISYMGTDYNWTEATDPVNGPIVDPNVYGWSRILHMYIPVADSLEPGYAYWMYAYQNCTLHRS